MYYLFTISLIANSTEGENAAGTSGKEDTGDGASASTAGISAEKRKCTQTKNETKVVEDLPEVIVFKP